ncbi:MAG: hypothetical protein ABSH31_03085 [Bryobacteraceae bacterium]|jgi:hypothetical protein
MHELLNSMIRLSAAMTVFGMQQIQTTVGSVDTKDSVDKLRQVIDAMADALSSKIDESRRPTLDRLSSLPRDIVTRSVDSTREVVKDTSNMVKTTSDWIAGTMKPAAAN